MIHALLLVVHGINTILLIMYGHTFCPNKTNYYDKPYSMVCQYRATVVRHFTPLLSPFYLAWSYSTCDLFIFKDVLLSMYHGQAEAHTGLFLADTFNTTTAVTMLLGARPPHNTHSHLRQQTAAVSRFRIRRQIIRLK